MTKHLDDMEIACFVDGVSDDRNKVIEHLNGCEYCFEITTATMQFVETEKDLCKQLDDSFHKLTNL